MDPVNGLSQIMQVLRQRLSGRSGEIKTKHGSRATTGTSSEIKARGGAKPGPDEILRYIGERIRVLTPEEKRGAKAMQIFVESVLVWEFGEELLQDPEFTEIAREVQQAIDANEIARQKLIVLLNGL